MTGKTGTFLSVALVFGLASALLPAGSHAQDAGSSGGLSGYVAGPDGARGASDNPDIPRGPALSDGRAMSPERIDGFNEAIDEAFPMTPEMIRRYREIFLESERAMLERTEPDIRIETGLVSLDPGEAPPELVVAPGLASVIGIYDATGQAWPVTQYVIGSGNEFGVLALGENGNNIVVTPNVRVGWTNLVLSLEDIAKPIVMRIRVSDTAVHYRHDIQVMQRGPNAVVNTAAHSETVREAGSQVLLSALSGVDLPQGSRPVPVSGVDARAWMVGDHLFVRSRHALLSPSWLGSLSGPNGFRVYEIEPASVALFSVNGQIVRADLDLP